MSAALPFEQLLGNLRRRGLVLGVREHELFYRLLARWQGESVHELRDAIAALLARNAHDVALVRQLFDELAQEPAAEAAPPAPARRRWLQAIGLGIVALAALALIAWLAWPEPIVEPPPPIDPGLKATADNVPPPPASPAPMQTRASKLPSSPGDAAWPLGALALAAGLVLLAYARRRGDQDRAAVRRAALESLPGPQNFRIPVPPYRAFPAADLDDVAGWLGRVITTALPSRTLDIERSVLASARRGEPRLLFAPRPPGQPLIVLDDVGDEMRPWRRKVDALLGGLERRGVQIERWYFDADASSVARTPFGDRVPFASLTARAEESSLLVVSTGAGILTEGRALAPWVKALARFERRAWLHPLEDPALWRRALARTPLPVFAIAPVGLARAARALGAEVPEPALRNAEPPRAAHAGDLAELRALVAMLPQASLPLLMALRERFLAHVPESALLQLQAERSAAGDAGVRGQASARWSALAGQGAAAGEREELVRRHLLELLRAAEPPAASVAHLRWRLARAEQAALLTHDPAAVAAAGDELALLAGSAVGAETDRLFDFLRAGRSGRDAVGNPPPRAPRDASHALGRPRASDFARALVVGVLAAGATLAARPAGTKVLPNVENRWQLEQVPSLAADPPDSARLEVRGTRESAGAPTEWDVLQDGKRSRMSLWQSLPGADADSTGLLVRVVGGHWYQLRGTLASGAWGLSNPLWVPAPVQPSTLLVRFTDAKSGAALDPRAYDVDGTLPGQSGQPLALQPGAHLLRAELAGYEAVEQSFVIEPARETSLAVPLQRRAEGPQLVTVAIKLPPGLARTDLLVDGKVWTGKPLNVLEDSIVRLKLSDPYYRYDQTFTASRETTSFTIDAKPYYGVLTVERPAGTRPDYTIKPKLEEIVSPNPRLDSLRLGAVTTYRGREGNYQIDDGNKVQTVMVRAGENAHVVVVARPVAAMQANQTARSKSPLTLVITSATAYAGDASLRNPDPDEIKLERTNAPQVVERCLQLAGLQDAAREGTVSMLFADAASVRQALVRVAIQSSPDANWESSQSCLQRAESEFRDAFQGSFEAALKADAKGLVTAVFTFEARPTPPPSAQ